MTAVLYDTAVRSVDGPLGVFNVGSRMFSEEVFQVSEVKWNRKWEIIVSELI